MTRERERVGGRNQTLLFLHITSLPGINKELTYKLLGFLLLKVKLCLQTGDLCLCGLELSLYPVDLAHQLQN